MKRIFYLITELDVGGAEKALYELATRLDRHRFVPIVGCLSGRGEVGRWLEQAGVEVLHFDLRGWWDVPAWFRLRRVLKEQRPAVLHSFLFHANLAGRLASVGLDIERIIGAVRVEEPRRWHLWLERWTQRRATAVTCVSESLRQYMHRRAKVPLEKLVVIPNAIAPERYDMPVARPPEEWRIPDGAPVVGAIGRLDEQKDPLRLLRAAAQVVKRLPETIFVFAGAGPLMEKCRAEALRLGIERNVRWIGWVADVRPLLARMDVLAMTSRWEGMPNVVLEAMACRKPVVATRFGSADELIVDGETGYIVSPGDDQALVAAIEHILEDPGHAKSLGAAGRARVEKSFTLTGMVEANQRLYN